MRTSILAVMLLLTFAINGQMSQGRSTSSATVAAAARTYASALAEPGSEDFARLFRLAFALGMGSSSPPEERGERSLDSSPAGVESDRRYQQNLDELSKDKGKIWGGKRVAPGDYPDVVEVSGPGGACTGTLVAANAVLTARHCLCGDVDETVTFGDDVRAPRRTVKVDAAKTDKATQCVRALDFGVLILAEEVTDVPPRRLATGAWTDQAKSILAVGFGRTEDPDAEPSGIKRQVEIPVASTACNGFVDSPRGAREDAAFYKCKKGQELVAGSPLLDRDSCNGDSGGPAFITYGSQQYLSGLTSRAVRRTGYRRCGDGGIYVRSDGDVLEWLTNHNIPVNIGEPAPPAPVSGILNKGVTDFQRALRADSASGVSSSGLVPASQTAVSVSAPPLKKQVTILGMIMDLPDGRVAVMANEPEAKPIVVSNGDGFPDIAKTLPLSIRVAPSPGGAEVKSAILSSEAQWQATKQRLPRTVADALDPQYKELGRAVQALFATDGGDTSEVEAKIEDVRQAFIQNYRNLQNAGRQARRAFLTNFREIQRDGKSFYGSYDVYPTASYERIFKASRAVGGVALRGELPECSGALIGSDLFLTARHCVEKYSPEELEVQFNYDEDLRRQPLVVDTYPILSYEILGTGKTPANTPLDYAIVRLGRNSDGEDPGIHWSNECVSTKRLRLQDPVYVIGHPQGERKKVHDNSHVFFPFRLTQVEMDELIVSVEAELLDDDDGAEKLDEFLRSYRLKMVGSMVTYEQYSIKWQQLPVIGVNTDTFHGNSGAPVFDRKRHHIIGVFFDGESDSGAYTPGWRRHEAVLPISEVIEQLRTKHSDWLRANSVCIADDRQVASR